MNYRETNSGNYFMGYNGRSFCDATGHQIAECREAFEAGWNNRDAEYVSLGYESVSIQDAMEVTPCEIEDE